MRKLLLFLFFAPVSVFCQEYKFEQINSAGIVSKAKGSVSISDNSIHVHFESDNNSKPLKVIKSFENGNIIQYKGALGDVEYRYTKSCENQSLCTLTCESKDSFSGKYALIIYNLIPQ